jgi:hypothetical protein
MNAEVFLSALREMGFYIIVASHRRQDAFGPTARWLEKNHLVHDELHLSTDKTVLFTDCWGVVDDNPDILAKAKDAGIVRAGLRNPWNEGWGHPLFDDLNQVLTYLRTQAATREPSFP